MSEEGYIIDRLNQGHNLEDGRFEEAFANLRDYMANSRPRVIAAMKVYKYLNDKYSIENKLVNVPFNHFGYGNTTTFIPRNWKVWAGCRISGEEIVFDSQHDLTSLGKDVIYGADLKTLILPDNITSIPESGDCITDIGYLKGDLIYLPDKLNGLLPSWLLKFDKIETHKKDKTQYIYCEKKYLQEFKNKLKVIEEGNYNLKR